jgi:hypothetical protein
MSFEQLIDLTMELPLNEREMLVDIISKRNILDKRKELAEYYKQVQEDYLNGELKSQSLKEIIEELEKEIE